MESACRVYRPRDPRKTPLWGLLDTLYERVKGEWEERLIVEADGHPIRNLRHLVEVGHPDPRRG